MFAPNRHTFAHSSLGFCFVLLGAVTSGCSFGSDVLAKSHLAYNQAVHAANEEEFLLNLVRLRYDEAPTFLGVDAISAQFEFEASIGGDFGLVEGESSRFGTPSIGYANRPTITFVPRRDEEFVRRFTAPISIDTFSRLVRYHSDLSRFFSIVVVRMNEVVNRHHEGDPRFDRAVALLSALHERHELSFQIVDRELATSQPFVATGIGLQHHLDAAKSGLRVRDRGDGTAEVVSTEQLVKLWMSPQAAETSELKQLLHLREDLNSFALVNSAAEQAQEPHEAIVLELRSVSHAMQVLAHAVEVPEEHVESGIVKPEQISKAVKQFFRVRASLSSPEEPGLHVYFRDSCYYLADTDLESKRTFRSICELLSYQVATTTRGHGPLLTLPVN